MARGTRPERTAMAKWSRVLILVASLALGLTYVLPIWTIKLEAPQYPEGLGMMIRINTIEGVKEHDLSNINNLNHYIGMKRIVPESIPELDIMPVIVGILMVTGLLVALVGRKRLLYAWTIGFLAISAVGLADFWKWEYDYGHDLDEETAIIKIPGMSYQPPLIGSRDILNFTAHSWPASGGIIAILAAMSAVVASAAEWRRQGVGPGPDRVEGGGRDPSSPPDDGTDDPSRSPDPATDEPGGPPTGADPDRPKPSELRPDEVEASSSSAPSASGPVTAGLPAVVALSACADPGPRPLQAGVDGCADCLMVLENGGHGAELVTTTGKVYTFDSSECMVNHLRTEMVERDLHSAWVTDFASPDELVEAEKAFYLVSPMLDSPMGLGITAFARAEDRDGAVNAFGGRPADWDQIRALVASAWPDGRPSMKHGGHATELVPPGDAEVGGG